MQNPHFIQSGSGPDTIVLLHYFGGSCHSWDQVMNCLPQVRCIAIDVPGFGQSAALTGGSTIENVSEYLCNFIQSLNLPSYTLAGHSMGGKLAMAIAAQKPRGLERLLLIAPSPPTPEPRTPQDEKQLLNCFGDQKATEDLVKGLVAKPLPPEVLQHEVANHLLVKKQCWNDWILKGSKQNIAAQTAGIHVPVQVVSADSDPVFSTTFLRTEFNKYFDAVQYTEVAASGHLLPIEQPQAIADIIMQGFGKYA